MSPNIQVQLTDAQVARFIAGTKHRLVIGPPYGIVTCSCEADASNCQVHNQDAYEAITAPFQAPCGPCDRPFQK
jgi:hypothetical protein